MWLSFIIYFVDISIDFFVELMRFLWEVWFEDKYLVLMEIGCELDCGLIYLLWLWFNFLEYKFDIFFVWWEVGGVLLNYKVVLYEDSEVNSVLLEFVYKLNVIKVVIRMIDMMYMIFKNNVRFLVIFLLNIIWFLVFVMLEF